MTMEFEPEFVDAVIGGTRRLDCGHTIAAGDKGYPISFGKALCYDCGTLMVRTEILFGTSGKVDAYVSKDGKRIETSWGGELMQIVDHTLNIRAWWWAVDQSGGRWFGSNGDGPGHLVRLRKLK